MKYVRKIGAPHTYTNWCREAHGTQDEDYRCLRNPVKSELHQALLSEQGWLCAYTMRRIDDKNSHIEHIKPETLCRSERVGSDLDYDNLVACFPRKGMGKRCRYGAPRKDNWWEDDGTDFVSPLQSNCERRFRFDLDGKINAVGKQRAALKTIEVLKLDHQTLTEDRKRVIHEFVYGENGNDPLSEAKTNRAIASICQRNIDGRRYEFCVAIRDSLAKHLRYLKKITKKKKYRSDK